MMIREEIKYTTITYQYQLQAIEYKPSEPGNYPVILFLHGNGERGDNVSVLEKNEIPALFKTDFQCPYIVLAPQMPKIHGSRWDNLIGDKIMAKLQSYNAPSYHITGLSMGGIGTSNFLGYYPGFFSTAGIVCGNINGSAVATKEYQRIHTRCWHGDKDTIVKPDSVVKNVPLLKAKGADIDLIMLPGVGHNAWDLAYSPDFIENYWKWLEEKI